MARLLVVLLLVVLLERAQAGPLGTWVRSPSTATYQYYVSTNTYTWDNAAAFCSNLYTGAQLASIRSLNIHNEIWTMNDNSNSVSAWIGGRRDGSSTTYYWIDGQSMTYRNWQNNEPSYTYQSSREDRMMLASQFAGKWNDGANSVLARAACQRIITSNPPTITCPATINVSPSGGRPGVTVSWSVTTTASVAGAVTVSCTPGNGTSFNIGVTNVTCTATDAVLLTNSCWFLVNNSDTTPPLITCPANISTATSGNVNFTQPSFNPVVSDAGGVATYSCTPTSGSKFYIANTTVACSVTDNAALTAACSFWIDLYDTTPPTLTCNNADVQATKPTGAAMTSFPSVSYSDASGIQSFTCNRTVPGDIPMGLTYVGCTAKDWANLTTSCSFRLNVSDTTPPVPGCPSNPTGPATGGYPYGTVTFSQTASDSGSGLKSASCNITSGNYSLGTTYGGCTATDNANNVASCTFTVLVTDATNPTITCPGSTSSCSGSNRCIYNPTTNGYPAMPTTLTPTATDTGSGLASVVCNPVSGFNFTLAGTTNGYTPVSCTATDNAGNTASCTNTRVYVYDTANPAVTCPNPVSTAPVNGSGAPVSWSFTATDGSGIKTRSCNATNGGMFPVGTTWVRCTATDNADKQTSCTFTVGVTSAAPPTISCPSNMNIQPTAGVPSAIATYSASAGGSLAITSNSCNPATGSNFTLDTNTSIVCTAFNTGGSSASCNFFVAVSDSTSPTITCPVGDTTVSPDAGQSYATVTYSPIPSGTDGSGIASVTCTKSSGSTFNVATTTVVTCTATDNADLYSTCSFRVIVRDNVPPTITCPADIAAPPTNGANAIVTFSSPVAADNVGIVSTSCSPASGSSFSGTTTVNCTTADAAGNTAKCSFKVAVQDTTPPVISCSNNVVGFTSKDLSTGLVNWNAPTATDNNGSPSVSCAPAIGTTLFSVGINPVVCTASDTVGNTASCSFNITVNDVQNPDISCPSSYSDTLPLDAMTSDQTWQYTANDNVGLASSTCTPASGSTFNYGDTTVVCTAVDTSNRNSQCSFRVTITDTQSPTVKCPAAYIGTTSAGSNTGTVEWSAPSVAASTATDNVGISLVYCSRALNDVVFPLGETSITCDAKDLAGNVGSCSFNVAITDKEPPVISCPADVTITVQQPLNSTTYAFSLDAPTDNVDPSPAVTIQKNGVLVPSGQDYSLFFIGRTVLTYSAIDSSNNSVSCSWAMIVLQEGIPVDTVKPVVNCPATTSFVYYTDVGKSTATGSWPAITYSDNVGVTSATYITSPTGYVNGARFPLGTTQIQFIASDAQGNFATCNFNVTIRDLETPRVSCPSSFELWCNPPLNYTTVMWQNPTFSDNVGLAASGSVTRVPGTYSAGTYSVIAAATDTSGNSASCNFTFTILTDTISPNVTCPISRTVSTDPDQATAIVTWPTPAMNDNRGVSSVVYGPSPYLSGASFPLGTTNMILAVTDIYNNVKTCNFKIVVQDLQPPILTCPSDFNVSLSDSSQTSVNVTWPEPAPIENVRLSTMWSSNVSGARYEVGKHTITRYANDSAGNSATPCSFTFYVLAAEASSASSAAAAGAGAAGAIGGIIFIIVLIMFVKYKRQQRQMRLIEEQYGSAGELSDEAVLARAQAIQQALQNKKRSETPSMKWLQITPADFKAPPKTSEEMAAYMASNMGKELNRDDVVIESEIGAGEFGSVCSGYLKRPSNGKLLLAIKTLKDGADESQKIKFLQEAAIMIQFRNPKIVELVGVVTIGEPVLICLEFMELGSLRTYLKSEFVFEKLTDADLIRMACDVCAGMHYLAESGFIHRDLAARNVLINKDFVCKVSDFGLSQEAAEDNSADKDEKIPIRWTAPEAVTKHQFSVASDVWSFGILLWEMWSYGAVPYKGWTNEVVMQNVLKEYRLPSPKNCPTFIYGLMLECWNEDPLDRPAFYDVFERLLACWNIVKPVSNYAKSYTYDANGQRVKGEYSATKVVERFEEEDGDMYDLGGETDKQIQGKRRVGVEVVPTLEVTRAPATLVVDDFDLDADVDEERAHTYGKELVDEGEFGFGEPTDAPLATEHAGYLQIDDN
eukprot:m.896514 g.896514  ORF g.896514 m.896514 type:complete len:2070 (+) comp60012_c0_seq1:33-6242(+)